MTVGWILKNERHFIDFKTFADVTLYEGFGFKAKVQADWALSKLLTSGSATCVMWFKGFGEYDGKIMELTFNEKD